MDGNRSHSNPAISRNVSCLLHTTAAKKRLPKRVVLWSSWAPAIIGHYFDARNAVYLASLLVDRSTELLRRGFNMKTSLGITIAAVAAFAALAGCTDLKPLQADIDSLKTQVGKLSSDVAAIKADRSAADAAAAAGTAARNASTQAGTASTAASAASAKADTAQAAANKAQADAAAAQAAVTALDEKVDRMFKRSISK
jgi:outer membrane murein-binding lipoprotein Lpp